MIPLLYLQFHCLQMQDTLLRSFRNTFGSRPEIYSSAPGRINIIGEHTDYNSGYVLPSAIDLHVVFLASKREDRWVNVRADNFDEEKRFNLDDPPAPEKGGWIDYVKGIYWVLEQDGTSLHGVDAFVWGNVPLESGLSSSAAFEVSFLHALDALFRLGIEPMDLARLAQKAENDYVGVKCGLMDQFISVFGKKEKAVFLDCETLAFEYIPLCLERDGLGILVYNSGVHRDLATSEYNSRRSEASTALEMMAGPGIRSYKDISLEMIVKKRATLGERLFKRARHVITENLRVKNAVNSLRDNDFAELGRLLFQSHESLRDDYQVSCPELDLLYDCGKAFPACLGARLTGAGFGGSGIALVRTNEISSFKKLLSGEAHRHGFHPPSFHDVGIGEGAYVRSIQLD